VVVKSSAFEVIHSQWMEEHLSNRKGEGKRRLRVGHGHAEKEMLKQVWWPAFGNLQYLHPEYEVIDFLEGRRFIDIAYIRPPIKIAFEIDGFGPHLKDISRVQFSNQWVRQMHLLNDNWIVVRISFDDIKDRPRLWQQLIQQMIGRLFGDSGIDSSEMGVAEKEVVRLAMRLNRAVKLSDVESAIQCGYRLARSTMNRLVEKHWFIPDGGGQIRTHSWKLQLNEHQIHSLLFL
jgi:hypothetical protein